MRRAAAAAAAESRGAAANRLCAVASTQRARTGSSRAASALWTASCAGSAAATSSGSASSPTRRRSPSRSRACRRYLSIIFLYLYISESVACLQAVLEQCAQHAFSPASGDTLVVCVGDGRTPRTAALVAMRSRWDCVSIDPALAGLEPPAAGEEGEGGSGDGGSSGGGECDSRCGECSDGDPAAEPLARLEKVAQARRGGGGGGAPKPLPVPKELRHANLLSQEASDAARAQRARLRTELRSIARLRLLPCRAEEAAVWVAARVTSVVVMLPHAHVTPDEALGCLRFGGERERGSAVPAIAVVQLPCCGYVWHGTALGQPPDVERLDGRICAAARTVRVWRDVSAHFNFGASARGLGARTAGG